MPEDFEARLREQAHWLVPDEITNLIVQVSQGKSEYSTYKEEAIRILWEERNRQQSKYLGLLEE